jgi:hypothetical protein
MRAADQSLKLVQKIWRYHRAAQALANGDGMRLLGSETSGMLLRNGLMEDCWVKISWAEHEVHIKMKQS